MSYFFLGLQKATLNYLAYLKVEISKIADNQQQILEYIKQSNNVNIFQGSVGGDQREHEVDYFIHKWPISTKEGLTDMEEKMKLDVNFKKQVVCYSHLYENKISLIIFLIKIFLGVETCKSRWQIIENYDIQNYEKSFR